MKNKSSHSIFPCTRVDVNLEACVHRVLALSFYYCYSIVILVLLLTNLSTSVVLDSYDDVKKYFKPCDVIFNFNCIDFTGTPFLDNELPYSTPTFERREKMVSTHDCCEYIYLLHFFSS